MTLTKEQILESIITDGTGIEVTQSEALEAMEIYAKQQSIAFAEFRDRFKHEENIKMTQEYKRVGGMFTWVGASDEHIYKLFSNPETNNIKA